MYELNYNEYQNPFLLVADNKGVALRHGRKNRRKFRRKNFQQHHWLLSCHFQQKWAGWLDYKACVQVSYRALRADYTDTSLILRTRVTKVVISCPAEKIFVCFKDKLSATSHELSRFTYCKNDNFSFSAYYKLLLSIRQIRVI